MAQHFSQYVAQNVHVGMVQTTLTLKAELEDAIDYAIQGYSVPKAPPAGLGQERASANAKSRERHPSER